MQEHGFSLVFVLFVTLPVLVEGKMHVIAWGKHSILTLRKKWPYSELFWSAFSHIRTEYGELRSTSSYSVRVRKNSDQNNSAYGHFLRSVIHYRKSRYFWPFGIEFWMQRFENYNSNDRIDTNPEKKYLNLLY